MHQYVVCVYFTQNFDVVKTDIFVYITEKIYYLRIVSSKEIQKCLCIIELDVSSEWLFRSGLGLQAHTGAKAVWVPVLVSLCPVYDLQ